MNDAGAHEIVIIKRVRQDGEAVHHGGVWKIAFADFMTAMMAFFLVMWLISANDKTRAAVARYFNPVQLVDSTPQPKGLNDPNPQLPSVAPKAARPAAEAKGEIDTSKHDDAQLFKDPYAVLAELAAKNSFQPVQQAVLPTSAGTKGGAGAVGLRSGDAYRDPFEPLIPSADLAAPPDQIDASRATPDVSSAPRAAPEGVAAPNDEKAMAVGAAAAPSSDQQARASALRSKVAAAVRQAVGPGAGEPKVEVRRTEEGLVISLTDDANFSMFASASAEPVPKMVGLMEKIGQILKAEKGKITLRGFTDNRPFKSDTYDNWRLSSARADMAHYMLVRGGLEDARIDRIEGYADRQPKNAKDPGGAENRRIEILLRDATP